MHFIVFISTSFFFSLMNIIELILREQRKKNTHFQEQCTSRTSNELKLNLKWPSYAFVLFWNTQIFFFFQVKLIIYVNHISFLFVFGSNVVNDDHRHQLRVNAPTCFTL